MVSPHDSICLLNTGWFLKVLDTLFEKLFPTNILISGTNG